MKFSFVLILIFLMLSGLGESADSKPSPVSQNIRPDKHKDAPKDVKAPAQQKSEEPTPFQILEAIHSIANEQKTANEQNAASQKSWNTPLTLVQIALVVVGVLYTFFAYRQWRAIHHQAKIAADGVIETRKAAEAAQKSSETASRHLDLISSHERPWIMVKPNWLLPDNEHPFGGLVEWSAINVGGTPAFLTELVVVADIVSYPIPSKQPDYPAPKPFAKFIIPPNGTHGSRTGNPIDASKLQKLFNGTHCFIFYGRIAYRDSLDDQHLTRFCCYWHLENGQWLYEPVGPPDWVGYT